jgi:hypothetical protein
MFGHRALCFEVLDIVLNFDMLEKSKQMLISLQTCCSAFATMLNDDCKSRSIAKLRLFVCPVMSVTYNRYLLLSSFRNNILTCPNFHL